MNSGPNVGSLTLTYILCDSATEKHSEDEDGRHHQGLVTPNPFGHRKRAGLCVIEIGPLLGPVLLANGGKRTRKHAKVVSIHARGGWRKDAKARQGRRIPEIAF